MKTPPYFLIPTSLFALMVFSLIINVSSVNAQPAPSINISETDSQGRGIFKFIVCDGPAGANKPSSPDYDPKYVPCDFKGLMLQVQHILNIMMVGGVFAAIFGFSWAGYLYITGKPANISKATSMFPKIGLGFILMLSAWFIVYQLLSWLTDNQGFKFLLGS